jgi:hypothetical protein
MLNNFYNYILMSSIIDFIPNAFRSTYNCTFNPNRGYITDCVGNRTNSSSTISGTGLSSSGATAAPPPLPNITKKFTLYKNQLPITIPSKANPLTDGKYVPGEDKGVNAYWITEGIPPSGYSDVSSYYDDEGNQVLETNASKWTGFLSALSKCIELDGTNGKQNCYAVAVQSDFTGVSITDSNMLHNYNYKLVALPTIQAIKAIDDNADTPQFASSKKIDSNFLFCQSQYYTWVKNLDSGVYNQYAPYYKVGSPSSSSSGQLTCPGEKYMSNVAAAPLERRGPPKDFWAPTKEVPIPFSPEPIPPKPNETRKYMMYAGIAFAVITILYGIYYWYNNYGPGVPPPAPVVDLPVNPTTSADIKKKKGGYFYY